jgi:hypothetical protein
VAWPACEWRGLRVGATSLDVRIAAAAEHASARITRTGGPALGVTVALALPSGRQVGDARIDGSPLVPRAGGDGPCRHAAATLDVSGTHDVEVWYR